MAPPRLGSLPAANKVFVDREGPLKDFEDAVFAIPASGAKILVFHGIGGQGKTALCRALWRMTSEDPSYRFLRRAEFDLHGKPKTDPDLLLVWIRNGFAKAGVALPCFDLAFAIFWEATRGEQPMPKMESRWLERHRDLIGDGATDLTEDLLKGSLGDVIASIPGLGPLIRSIGGWAIKRGHEKYLHQTREALSALYRDGELKKPFEISALLPWMLAQDLNHHLANNPKERFVLFIDEYERVFDEGGAGVRWKENPFDEHMRLFVQETNGLLAVFFSRERLPWEGDPDWRAELASAQHLLGGLKDEDADKFLRAVPITDEALRSAMIEGARETSAHDAPVYALMLDLQVEHWRSLVAQGKSIVPEAFGVAAKDFEGRRRELVDRVLRDYSAPLQSTLKRLSFARRFDRPAFEHIVKTFHTGLPLDAFDALEDMSFLTRDADGYLSIHGIVAEAIREMLDAETRRMSLEALFQHYSGRGVVDSNLDVTNATVTALFEAAYYKRQLSKETYLDWHRSAVEPLSASGRYADAVLLSREAVKIAAELYGPEHPVTATSMNRLAHLLQAQGDLANLKPLFEQSLEIRENTLGPDHPDTATSLNNLATLRHMQGDLAGAKPLYERALEIRKRVLGSEHPDTVMSLNNLAHLLKAQGDLSAAKPLFEQALAVNERVLGTDHRNTATSLNSLGYLLREEGDLVGAKQLYHRALAIREKILGPEHPDSATSLNNLAYVLQAQEDFAAAKALYERALAINERRLGPEHPDTAMSFNNLAGLLETQGDPYGSKATFRAGVGYLQGVNR
jgi:tetratricopeptide (TPR) repeat protein